MIINQTPTENVEGKDILLVENEYWVGLNRDLEVLQRTPEFKRVILEAYFKDRAINGVSMLSNPAVKARNERSELMEEMVAISNLQHFLMMIANLGTIPLDEEE